MFGVGNTEDRDQSRHVLNDQLEPSEHGLEVTLDSALARLEQELVRVSYELMDLCGLVVKRPLECQHEELCRIAGLFDWLDKLYLERHIHCRVLVLGPHHLRLVLIFFRKWGF